MNARSVLFCFLKAAGLLLFHMFFGVISLFCFTKCSFFFEGEWGEVFFPLIRLSFPLTVVFISYFFFSCCFSNERQKEKNVTMLFYPVSAVIFFLIFRYAIDNWLISIVSVGWYVLVLAVFFVCVVPNAIVLPITVLISVIRSSPRKTVSITKEIDYGNDEQ